MAITFGTIEIAWFAHTCVYEDFGQEVEFIGHGMVELSVHKRVPRWQQQHKGTIQRKSNQSGQINEMKKIKK